MIITIDGPIATGKSTIAKRLAKELGFIFFDTGAMYRSFAYYLMSRHIDYSNAEQLKAALADFHYDIKRYRGDRRYFVNGEDVTTIIRTPEVTEKASEIAAIKEVRATLILIQRSYAEDINAVFEGRDMGTVVFPHADVKIFLTGRADVRAKRRLDEFKEKFPDKPLTLDEVTRQIEERDRLDSTREISPLKQADDAFVVDTSDLTIDQVVLQILEYKDSLKHLEA